MSLLKQFIKYQSLGNDFVVFDWFKKPALFVHAELSGDGFGAFVRNLCDRHRGVGADGVLVITNHPQASQPEVTVFNADGSRAESCLNGVRCIAHHLYTEHHFPNKFSLLLGQRVVDCTIIKNDDQVEIITQVGSAQIHGPLCVQTEAGAFDGSVVSIGNPHYFVFDAVSLEWLAAHGKAIESHASFPQRTNVEFVWPQTTPVHEGVLHSYGMHVYERGCGVTLACSSGAAALTALLHAQGAVRADEKIGIAMPGGAVVTWIAADGTISLQAPAHRVFTGLLED